jgi:hypothetical protein
LENEIAGSDDGGKGGRMDVDVVDLNIYSEFKFKFNAG